MIDSILLEKIGKANGSPELSLNHTAINS